MCNSCFTAFTYKTLLGATSSICKEKYAKKQCIKWLCLNCKGKCLQKKSPVAKFKRQCQHLHTGTDENHEKLQGGSNMTGTDCV
jgi:hypothetical protein